jgi:hypothetical protein
MGCCAKKVTLIIYTRQACVLENTGFQNMDYPTQKAAGLQNTIWAAYNQRESEEDGVCRKKEKWGRQQDIVLTRKQEDALQKMLHVMPAFKVPRLNLTILVAGK